jgi:membrane-associated protease RseP (regulator of RpoE activity)
MNQGARKAFIHLGLFMVTFVTTTIAGSTWSFGKLAMTGWFTINPDFTFADFQLGLPYSITFLSILTVHEFGHFFTAMYHRVRATLPYYLPLPPPFLIGTLGAVIRLSRVPTREKNFDIGIAGPLAGFILALGFLIYGFATLPGLEYLFQIHPEYEQYGSDYAQYAYTPERIAELGGDMVIGKNLLFLIVESFAHDPSLIPNGREIMHYPILLATYLSLLFTALNLLPIGQLDGGHVTYGLFGRRLHRTIGSITLWAFIFYAGLGVLPPGAELSFLGFFNLPHFTGVPVMIAFYYFCLRGLRVDWKLTLMHAFLIFALQYVITFLWPTATGYSGWFVFALIVGRFITVLHPGAEVETPISTGRKILGWIALIVFVLCFSPNPIVITVT